MLQLMSDMLSVRVNSLLLKSAVLLVTALFFSSCTHYHVVAIKRTSGDENKTYYAMARNNTVVPEYSIGGDGRYPTTKEEVRQLFERRKDVLNEIVIQKYDIESNITYQARRIPAMIGLLAVCPITIPIIYFSEKSLDEPRTFVETVKYYFDIASSEPVIGEPGIIDPLVVGPIAPE